MDGRRPNECPRCGFVYTACNRPKHGTFGERFVKNLRDRPKYGWGPLAHARMAEAEQTRPWRCRCGTWLRAKAWTFGWVDLVGIAVLAILEGLLAVRYPWVWNPYVFAIPIGLWVVYRVSSQVEVEEVPADAAEELAS
jgi:hypothetical protein